jgi:hypothetical protein
LITLTRKSGMYSRNRVTAARVSRVGTSPAQAITTSGSPSSRQADIINSVEVVRGGFIRAEQPKVAGAQVVLHDIAQVCAHDPSRFGTHSSGDVAFDGIVGETRQIQRTQQQAANGTAFFEALQHTPVHCDVTRFAFDDSNAALERLRTGQFNGAIVLIP